MATNAEEFLLKLNSNIAPVAGKGEIALRSLDAQIRAAQRAVAGLDLKAVAAASAAAQQEQKVALAAAAVQKAGAGYQGSVDVGRMRAAQAKLAAEQRALDAMNAKAAAAKAAAAAERGELGALQAARPALAAKAKALDAAAVAEKKAAAGAKDLGASVSAAGGPMSGLASQVQSLVPLLEIGTASLIALGATALAVVLVAGALAAYGALVKFAFAAAGARREAVLLGGALEGVSRRPGAEFNAVVDQLARRVPLAKDKIQEIAKEMALLKLGGRDLQAGLTATAVVTSALGDAAGRGVRGIVEQSQAIKRFTLGARDMYGEYSALAGTGMTKADVLGALSKQLGRSVPEVEKMLFRGQVKLKDGLRALESAAQGRFGKTIAGQMLSFDNQIAKAKENLASFFDGVDLGPALEGLRSFLSIFDEGTVTGKTMKLVLTTGLQAISNALAVAGPIAKEFFLGMAIAALKTYIALKPIYNRVRDFFGFKPGDGLEKALTAGKVAFYAIGVAAAVVGASLLLAFSPFIVIGAALYGVFLILSSVWRTVSRDVIALYNAFSLAYDYIASIDFGELGWSIIDAIVNALKSGAGQLFESIKSIGSDMLKNFKASIQSASPSKLFRVAGETIPQGVALGVDAGTGDVHEAIEGMGRARPAGAAGGPPGAAPAIASGGGQGVQVTFNGPVTIGGADGDKEALADFIVGRITGALFGSPAEAGA
jgi:hypothetical protein